MPIFKKKAAKKEESAAPAPAGRVFAGVVASDKMKDTVVVVVTRTFRHAQYGKLITKRARFKAHDAGNTKKVGDKVSIRECRPISKDKHFTVIA